MIAPSSGSIEQLFIAAETDVALFALGRCDIGGIATWRGSVAGIGRAQLAWVYAKSGVESPIRPDSSVSGRADPPARWRFDKPRENSRAHFR